MKKLIIIVSCCLILLGCDCTERAVLPEEIDMYLDGVWPGGLCVPALPNEVCVNENTIAVCNYMTDRYQFTTIEPGFCIEYNGAAFLNKDGCHIKGIKCHPFSETVVECDGTTAKVVEYCPHSGLRCVEGECI